GTRTRAARPDPPAPIRRRDRPARQRSVLPVGGRRHPVIELRGDHVVLRGFRPEEVAVALERMQTLPATEMDEAATAERRERLERSGERNGSEIMLAVEADGRLVGDVQGRCPRFALPPGVWELGIELWDAADRGRGIGRETVALLSSHLFAREDAIRVQAT